ncbi:MAG: hypothetical protein ACJ750_11675 [Gaiellaceae bacterium]
MDEYPSRQEQHRINDADFAQGWRESFEDAVYAALAEYPDGTEATIEEIQVRKRGDSSVHDHKVRIRT